MTLPSMDVYWNTLDRRSWQRLLLQAPRYALQQEWAYGQAICEQGHQVHRAALMRGGKPLALAQIAERRIAGPLRMALLMRGPVPFGGYDEEAECHFLGVLRRHLAGAVLMWTPEAADSDMQARRRAGYRRVLTGYSTIMLDLAKPLPTLRAGLHGKWRNLLRAGEKSGLVLQSPGGGQLVDWLIERNEQYRKQVGYAGPTPEFIRALGRLAPRPDRIVLLAMENRAPVAGVILQLHGRAATYYAGCTTPRGRQLRAHHFLLWQAVVELKDRGVMAFDLGGIDTDKAPGIARFKLGMGGRPLMLDGTYLVPPFFGRDPAPAGDNATNEKGPQIPAAPSRVDKKEVEAA